MGGEVSKQDFQRLMDAVLKISQDVTDMKRDMAQFKKLAGKETTASVSSTQNVQSRPESRMREEAKPENDGGGGMSLLARLLKQKYQSTQSDLLGNSSKEQKLVSGDSPIGAGRVKKTVSNAPSSTSLRIDVPSASPIKVENSGAGGHEEQNKT